MRRNPRRSIATFPCTEARAKFGPMNLDGHRNQIRAIELRVQQLKESL
ncbi:MAG: hypothetical protein HZB39_10950 [Planctomycetes bacterium]|nr:hypothetical protein [Planctomycetota bacterium]